MGSFAEALVQHNLVMIVTHVRARAGNDAFLAVHQQTDVHDQLTDAAHVPRTHKMIEILYE